MQETFFLLFRYVKRYSIWRDQLLIHRHGYIQWMQIKFTKEVSQSYDRKSLY